MIKREGGSVNDLGLHRQRSRGCVRVDQKGELGVIDQEGGRGCDLGPHRQKSRGCVRVDQEGELG